MAKVKFNVGDEVWWLCARGGMLPSDSLLCLCGHGVVTGVAGKPGIVCTVRQDNGAEGMMEEAYLCGSLDEMLEKWRGYACTTAFLQYVDRLEKRVRALERRVEDMEHRLDTDP